MNGGLKMSTIFILIIVWGGIGLVMGELGKSLFTFGENFL